MDCKSKTSGNLRLQTGEGKVRETGHHSCIVGSIDDSYFAAVE